MKLYILTLNCLFFIPLEVQGHTVPHWKVISSGKYEPRGLRCSSTYDICQNVLKSANLLHKRDFFDSQIMYLLRKKSEFLCPLYKKSSRAL